MASSLEYLHRSLMMALAANAAPGLEAGSLVRTWPGIVSAVRAASQSIPTDDLFRTIPRATLIGRGQHVANERHEWPAAGAPEPQFQKIGATLQAVASRRFDPVPLKQHGEAHDVLASILWVTSHTVARQCRDRLYDLRLDLTRSPSPEMLRENTLVDEAYARATSVEHISSLLHAKYPPGMAFEARKIVAAVADWDLEANTALLTNRSTSALTLIARNESSIQRGMGLALTKCVESGAVDPATGDRLLPTLHRLADAWEDLVVRTMELAWGTQDVSSQAIRAAERVRSAFENTNLHHMSGNSQLAVVDALNSHLSSSVGLSAAARELLHDGELRAPARAIHRMLNESNPYRKETPVDPRDLMRGTSTPIPAEARDLLAKQVDAVCSESREALHRGASLDGRGRSPSRSGISNLTGPKAVSVRPELDIDSGSQAPGLSR